MNARDLINAADKATDIVLDNMFDAASILNRSVQTNGYGVLVYPSDVRDRLIEAKEKLEEAIAAYRSVSWPTGADYDQLEEIEAEEMRQRQMEEGWL